MLSQSAYVQKRMQQEHTELASSASAISACLPPAAAAPLHHPTSVDTSAATKQARASTDEEQRAAAAALSSVDPAVNGHKGSLKEEPVNGLLKDRNANSVSDDASESCTLITSTPCSSTGADLSSTTVELSDKVGTEKVDFGLELSSVEKKFSTSTDQAMDVGRTSGAEHDVAQRKKNASASGNELSPKQPTMSVLGNKKSNGGKDEHETGSEPETSAPQSLDPLEPVAVKAATDSTKAEADTTMDVDGSSPVTTANLPSQLNRALASSQVSFPADGAKELTEPVASNDGDDSIGKSDSGTAEAPQLVNNALLAGGGSGGSNIVEATAQSENADATKLSKIEKESKTAPVEDPSGSTGLMNGDNKHQQLRSDGPDAGYNDKNHPMTATATPDSASVTAAEEAVAEPQKATLKPAPPPADAPATIITAATNAPPRHAEVVDLLESDDGDDDDEQQQSSNLHPRKRQRLSNGGRAVGGPGLSSVPIQPGSSLGAQHLYRTSLYPNGVPPVAPETYRPSAGGGTTLARTGIPPLNTPQYKQFPPGFVPTWNELIPRTKPAAPPVPVPRRDRNRVFQLSLLNVNEFTITGLPATYNGPPTSVVGLRKDIRKISKESGKTAVFEKHADVTNADELAAAAEDGEDLGEQAANRGEGKWRIPLAAYHAFYIFLTSDPMTQVEGIPDRQLNIASVARERESKGYPSVQTLVERGVPTRLANALAPFQRGGVDFVLDKGGRALIADDMGLGKTIQGIASMSVYHQEWPLLVLCPSSARYHWEAEFRQWLGSDKNVNSKKNRETFDLSETSSSGEDQLDANDSPRREELVLKTSQIHVLTSSKEPILPSKETQVVICSYGLVSLLAKNKSLVPRTFKCAIVDESHMLKNMKSQRTVALLPVLEATDRCVLLSGTPALAKPGELYPQLAILNAQQYDWWKDQDDFINMYVRKTSARQRAELHTMLSGTVMIRRLKADILKTLPKKQREKANVHVIGHKEQRDEFKQLLELLRKGKGTMGRLARKQHEEERNSTDDGQEVYQSQGSVHAAAIPKNGLSIQREAAESALKADISVRFQNGRIAIEEQLASYSIRFGYEAALDLRAKMEQTLRSQLEALQSQGLATIREQFKQPTQETERTHVLNRLYSLTGEVKIPLIVDMLNRWLNDPTKGKLCIFAHHISVLNAIGERAGLSNDRNSARKFIRIDGSTTPKTRQQQITTFQTDPSTRVALLGITAAGVAVTLTASSTVWFAELFWTPAIMIQAEDRCHRIGQQARVKCLYFVAKGTVDDVLWKLIEKKFRDLGEFVEGKEKQKMIVDRTYANAKELFSIFRTPDAPEDEDSDSEEDEDLKNLLLDAHIEEDIEMLGEEERQMLRAAEAGDDDGDQSSPSNTREKRKSTTYVIDSDGNVKSTNDDGRTEAAAITLSDDDEEEEDAKPAAKPSGASVVAGHSGGGSTFPSTNVVRQQAPPPATTRLSSPAHFSHCRIYDMHFGGPSLGLEIAFFFGRVVVAKLTDERRMISAKPAVGDILVAINGNPVPLVKGLNIVSDHVQAALQHPPIVLTFAEDDDFRRVFYEQRPEFAHGPGANESSAATAAAQHSGAAARMMSTQQQQEQHLHGKPPPPPTGAGGVIELLSDSEDEG